jgi:hypothetical protein
MGYNQVPQTSWAEFAEHFSAQHRGWRASLYEVDTQLLVSDPLAADTARKAVIHEAPLREVRLETPGEMGQVVFGDGELQQEIAAVSRVYESFGESSEHRGLRIDTLSGLSFLLQFRVAADPVTLDGIAEEER